LYLQGCKLPCKICKHTLLHIGSELKCPKCSDLKIIDDMISIEIAQKRINHIRKLWKTELDKIQRDSLLLHLLVHRETQARKFFKQPGILDIDSFFSDTLFIRRVLKEGNPNGAYVIDNTSKSEKIITLFNETKRVETDFSLVKSKYAFVIPKNNFNLDDISDEEALSNFIIVSTEDHDKLMKSYENYNLYSMEEAQKKQQEYVDEFEKILKEKPNSRDLTREEFVERNYETINSLYTVLLRNYIYAEVFDLRSYKELINDPSRLIKFVNQYDYVPTAFTQMNVDEFIRDARKWFKKSPLVIKRLLLCDENNPNIFPLFVHLNVEKKDFILLSQAFTAILYILLHAIITKDLFDIETNKLGILFEDAVKKKFEELGYAYYANVTDHPTKKTLEIDGIAIKEGLCFVIECKNRRLPPVVESLEAKKIMTEDLQGVIDGKKRIPKNGQQVVIDVPSLLTKIKYVQENSSKYGLSRISKSKIAGIVVTKDYPILSSYKGINCLWINDIVSEKLVQILK